MPSQIGSTHSNPFANVQHIATPGPSTQPAQPGNIAPQGAAVASLYPAQQRAAGRAMNAALLARFQGERWLASNGTAPVFHGPGGHALPPPVHAPALRHPPLTDTDRAPYMELEGHHRELFAAGGIERLPEDRQVWFDNVADVHMDEVAAIKVSPDQPAIATGGLGPCIAICARGKTENGETVLGMHHFSGAVYSPEDAMAAVQEEMESKGATKTSFFLIGGMMLPAGVEGGSLESEQRLLALHDRYDIQSVRLHVSDGEQDPATGRDNSVDVVMTADQIYFRHERMHEYKPADDE